MALRINDEAPDFTADTTEGTINFHEWIGDGWALLFSHPKDFTPVCTTELGTLAGLKPEFAKRNCKILGISVDSVSNHEEWSKDIEASQGHAVNYPLIGDPELNVVKAYDMLPADAGDTSEGRTPADNATARCTSTSSRTATAFRLSQVSGWVGPLLVRKYSSAARSKGSASSYFPRLISSPPRRRFVSAVSA